MQEAGLLTREPAAHDRRGMVVSLTDAGRTLQGPQ
ncbi:winged helix DNA-binding protein [Streptomyces pimonensis]|uniref:Winged helix DNA-binding protein n=1 Tax=Streptomyces pimonensis TaxID=2860288 RepID=A0ABV4J4I9_9ACTN